MSSIKVEVKPAVQVKVSIACRLGCLGKSCDFADKGTLLPDGTPICLGRMPVEEYDSVGHPNFCCQGNIEIKKK
jgi:hypothetical protein